MYICRLRCAVSFSAAVHHGRQYPSFAARSWASWAALRARRLCRSARSFLRDRRRNGSIRCRTAPPTPFGGAKATPPRPPEQKRTARAGGNGSLRTNRCARPARARHRLSVRLGLHPAGHDHGPVLGDHPRYAHQPSTAVSGIARPGVRAALSGGAGSGPPARRRPVISGRRTDAAESLLRSRPEKTPVAPAARRGVRNPPVPQQGP